MLLHNKPLDKTPPEGHHPTGGVGNATLTLWRSIAERGTGRIYHATLVERAIASALGYLADWSDAIRQDGPTAPPGCFIWHRVRNDKDYAALRSELPIFDGRKTKSLGRVGKTCHRDWEQRIKRRDALAEIEAAALALTALSQSLRSVVDPGTEPMVSGFKKARPSGAQGVLEAIAALTPEERRTVLAELMEVAA